MGELYLFLSTVIAMVNRDFQLEKIFSIEDRGQTDRITALPRSHALDSVAGLGHATLHASPR